MVKTIAKETGIVILLLIAVILVSGIVFYDYIPNNKTVPAKIEEYTLPQEVKTELEDSMNEEQDIVRTYYIDSSDLSVYEASNDYDKGNANPFADYSATTSNENTSSNSNNTSNNSNSNNINTNNSQNTSQSETFFNNSGK